MFRFASPIFLLLLAWVPIVLFLRKRKNNYPSIYISGTHKIDQIKPSLVLKAQWLLPVLKYFAFCLMIIAMARPQWGTHRVTVQSEGINIILAVDISESMAALDFKQEGQIVNRLKAVKGVVADFISKRDGDRIGLVVFGSHAYTQIPLTRDYQTIMTILEKIEIGAAGKSTAIGDAIGISLKRLQDIDSKSNIIILLTDGRSNSGELTPEESSRIASARGVKIYTIGVGSKGKAPFLIKHPFLGEQYVYQQVDMDENSLKAIASETQGRYFKAEDLTQLEQVYDQIDKLEKTETRIKTFAEYDEFYRYLLWPAFLILVVLIVLTNTRFLRIP